MNAKNKSVIAFGCDEQGKAKAARFDVAQEAAVRKAAGQMNFRLGWPKSPPAITAAAKVPEGALTDNGFVAHPVSDELFSKLGELLSSEPMWASNGIIPGNPTASDPDVLKAAEATLNAIKPGVTVLAWELSESGETFGWSAAIILSIKNDQSLRVHWRDWSGGKQPFTVDRRAVALLPPGNGK